MKEPKDQIDLLLQALAKRIASKSPGWWLYNYGTLVPVLALLLWLVWPHHPQHQPSKDREIQALEEDAARGDDERGYP